VLERELMTMSSRDQHANGVREFIERIPIIGTATKTLARARQRRSFPGSASFWEARYRNSGTSGGGSYGRLAQFKAVVLNDFVRTHGIRTVIELGCGDGAQLQLAEYPEYVGIDVAAASIERCSAVFAHDHTKRFYLADALPSALGKFDLALSLDVIFHLVEETVFDAYMRSLFARSRGHVVIYASNYDAATEAPHVRHRKFSAWITQNAGEWQPTGYIPNRFPYDPDRPDDTSFADFHFFARETP
jgi:SAM-dependent methyltransferase